MSGPNRPPQSTLPRPTILDLELDRAHTHDYIYFGSPTLHALCIARGVHPGTDLRAAQLLHMLNLSRKQAIVYDGFATSNLSTFLSERNLVLEEGLISRQSQAETDQLSWEQGKTDFEKRQRERVEKMIRTKRENAAKRKHTQRVADPKPTAIDTQRPVLQPDSLYKSAPASSNSTASDSPAKPRISGSGSSFPSTRAMRRRKRHLTIMANRLSKDYRKAAIYALEAADRDFRFDFLRLPPELRLRVYHLVCRASSTIVYPDQPPITKVCHLVRAEALPIYYSFNRFAVIVNRATLYSNNRWLETTSAADIACIRSLDFVLGNTDMGLEIDFAMRGQEFNVTSRGTYMRLLARLLARDALRI